MHYEELLDLLRQGGMNMKIRYTELYRIFCSVLNEATSQSRMEFSGPFARLTHLAAALKMDVSLRLRLNALRSRCRDLDRQQEEDLLAELPYDILAVAQLVQLTTRKHIPSALRKQLPVGPMAVSPQQQKREDCLRVCVVSWDETYIEAASEGGDPGETLRICYADPENRMGRWDYLGRLLWEGCQLNLVNWQDRGGILYAELIILEPDCLTDISRLARCFGECGATPYYYLYGLLQPPAQSAAILMGNMAGLILDLETWNTEDQPTDYKICAQEFIRQNALDVITCPDSLQSFHQEARTQQQNIRRTLTTLEEEDPWFHRIRTLLEPSFFCEMLGLQGRMDLLQDDLRVLLEQKSGKRAFQTATHREGHYVQMLLYQAVLHYAFHLRNDQVSCYLLYSRYSDGLIKETPAPHLLFQALQVRNQMVWLQFQMSHDAGRLLDALTPIRLNPLGRNDRLWNEFQRPQIEATLLPLRTADATARAYVNRMMTFLAREHLLSRIGTPGREASGMASLWNSSLQEKIVAGDIVHNLIITQTETDGMGRISTLHLTQSAFSHPNLASHPNFRRGDIVVLYSYPKDEEPDVRRTIVHRASIAEIKVSQDESECETSLVVHLRNAQHNTHVFEPGEGLRWAMEKDSAESASTALYRSVYSLLTATEERRALLLGQRSLEVSPMTLSRDYSQEGRFPHFNQLVLQARQARDCFLLIGPPGTGKTSFGLVNILLEELASSEEGVLLLSYTNRAVDEICSKLTEQGLDFLRIGSAESCAPDFLPYLFSERVKDMEGGRQSDSLRSLIINARIVVGTTTAITAAQAIFQLRRFGLAIIDEASQILEPHLLGILCARHGTGDAIRRFVMIGDHRQLPAVVRQEPEESAVTDPLLNAIGLMNCRESLFQRLLRMSPESCIFSFSHQGRMHPQVAAFANEHFYGGLLEPVPLPHQQDDLHFEKRDEDDTMQAMLSSRRVVFLPSSRPSHITLPKVNLAEARMIAKAVWAVWRLYTLNGRDFRPETTVGVIVPYRHQIAAVHSCLAAYHTESLNRITIDTVERYQGSQRDVIIYGFTVQMPHQLDFLCSQSFQEDGITIDRKLNVALTRAREQLVLIGNPSILSLNPLLRQLSERYGLEGNIQ